MATSEHKQKQTITNWLIKPRTLWQSDQYESTVSMQKHDILQRGIPWHRCDTDLLWLKSKHIRDMSKCNGFKFLHASDPDVQEWNEQFDILVAAHTVIVHKTNCIAFKQWATES